MDAGESYEAAAERELGEELGISGAKLVRIGHLAPCEETGMEHVELYAAMHGGKVRFPAAEIAGVLPFPAELIDRWIERRPEDFASSFITCWRLVRPHIATA